MKIIHVINDFLFDLFSVENNNIEGLKREVEAFYTFRNIIPVLRIKNNVIKIEIPISNSTSQKRQNHKKLIELCDSGMLKEAKVFANELIKKYPAESEFHRILGQVNSDLGNQEEAISSLISALKWNSKNVYALLMLGNVFAKYKSDIDTAMVYYDQAIMIKPDDNFVLNNIGVNLMQLGQIIEAKKYFNRAIKIDPNYPNTYFALSMLAELEKDLLSSFDYAIRALSNCKMKDDFYQKCFKNAIEVSKKVVSKSNAFNIINQLLSKLAYESEKEIRIEKDNTIQTAAKIEIAENYQRSYHLVKYKSDYPAVEHLILHELLHLELILEARNVKENQLFMTNDYFKSSFFNSLKKETYQYQKKGYSEKLISKILNIYFDGLNKQIYNTPIDLFIEDRIFNNFIILRPYQFLSMLNIIQEGIEATTRRNIVEFVPKSILSKSKIYNLVNALHFNELYRVDFVSEHNPTKHELNQATDFYNEFLEYRKDKEPAEEYELVQHWSEDLSLNKFFELIHEDPSKRKTIDDIISEIEQDPYGIELNDSRKERQMKKFLKEHSTEDINMVIVMFMIGALEKFDNLDKDKVQSIAFEFATLGLSGINPNKDGYSIPSFGEEKFSGNKALSYYYVSWAIAIPSKLNQLQIPFDKEYSLAKQLKTL